MAETLRRRVHEYAERNPDARRFTDRLVELIGRIERDFDSEEGERLLALARDAFDRHVAMRTHTLRARSALAALRVDQNRLLALLEWLTRTRRSGDALH